MGCTIIYTSHYMEEVEEICTRIAIIDHGKIIAEGTKEQLKAIITDTKDIRIETKTSKGFPLTAIARHSGHPGRRGGGECHLVRSRTETNNLNAFCGSC